MQLLEWKNVSSSYEQLNLLQQLYANGMSNWNLQTTIQQNNTSMNFQKKIIFCQHQSLGLNQKPKFN